jgi:hypothetical protein
VNENEDDNENDDDNTFLSSFFFDLLIIPGAAGEGTKTMEHINLIGYFAIWFQKMPKI